MTRQEQLKEIGEMIPEDFMSYFIIPIPHKFYENNSSIFNEIKKIEWSVINNTEVYKGRQLGAFNIKTYIYENMIAPLDKNNHMERYNSLLLKKKLHKKAKLSEYQFNISEVDLWIFDEHISFFVIKTDIDHSKYSINQLSEFNRQFREFKFLDLDSTSEELLFSRSEGFNETDNGLVEYLMQSTHVNGKSFLKVDKTVCTQVKTKNSKPNPLYQIYNTSTNAKLLTAVQTSTSIFSNGDEIEPLHETDLKFNVINGTSTLEEVPFYLASCSSLNPEKGYMSNEEYIHALVDNGGLNIWKYSSGITIHDSFSLFGLGRDGGPVVRNMESQFYFIYMLNLYINFQVRFVENKLINEEFESLDINYWYKKLQKLKNQFITREIGIKFQENELHKSMMSALGTEDMLGEITDNLMETKEITQNNIGIYFTLIGFIVFSVLEEPITSFVATQWQFVVPPLIVLFAVWLKYKRRIKKNVRSFKSKWD